MAVDGGGWEIYVGGAAGAHIRKGDLLAKVHSHEDVLRIATRFLQYYRENARWLERTYSFVPRIGLDEIKAIVVDDRDGVGAQLDAGMQVSIDAYSDPWREADEPVTPGQFRPSLPLVELPLVPVR